MHPSAALVKAGVGKKDQVFLLKTPQIQQQVAPNVQPVAFFRHAGVKRRAVRAMEGVRSARLPGNSSTGSQFPRQTEGLRATWTFWLAPSTESAGRRDTHGHGLLQETTATEPKDRRIRGGEAAPRPNIWREKALNVPSWERKGFARRGECVFSDEAQIKRLGWKRHRWSQRWGPY